MTDEHDLIDRASRGDDRAYRELYERHVTPLYRFLRQYTQDTALVEEWVQRAFIKAFRGLSGFQRTSRFSSWLFTIALNEMRDDRRRAKPVAFDSAELEAWNGATAEPADFLWEEAMRSLIQELGESQRTAFLLHEVEGYSHAEIAGILGVGEGTSRSLLARAKRYLKEQIQRKEMLS
jgi:RNA polymerase sigma-70 factor (ECF subfamily)